MNSPSKLTFSAWLSSRTGRVVLSLALVLALAFFVRAYVDIYGGSDEANNGEGASKEDCGDYEDAIDDYAACVTGERPMPSLVKVQCGLYDPSVTEDMYVDCIELVRNALKSDNPDVIEIACGLERDEVSVDGYNQCLEEWEQSEALGGR